MKYITLPDFLTEAELTRCAELYKQLKGEPGRFAFEVNVQIIAPNIARINEALKQENDPRYLAYMVEYVFDHAQEAQADMPAPEMTPNPGKAWEMTADVCQFCGAHIGYGVRFLHLGVCDDCRAKGADKQVH